MRYTLALACSALGLDAEAVSDAVRRRLTALVVDDYEREPDDPPFGL